MNAHLSSVLNHLSFPAVHFRICNNVCKRFNHRIPPIPCPFSSPHPFITLLSSPVYPFLGLLSHLNRAANAPPIFPAPLPYHIRVIPNTYMPHVQVPPSSFPCLAKSPCLLLSSIEIFVALTRCYLSFLNFSTTQFNLPR